MAPSDRSGSSAPLESLSAAVPLASNAEEKSSEESRSTATLSQPLASMLERASCRDASRYDDRCDDRCDDRPLRGCRGWGWRGTWTEALEISVPTTLRKLRESGAVKFPLPQ